MAQQQAAPAAQAPIVVVVDEVQITSDAMLVLVPGAQHVKDHTSFLSWTTVYDNAGAVTSYTLGQSDAKGAFLPRCQFSVDQQTGTLLDGNHVLNVLYNGAFWSRLLTALDAANLFATSPLEKIGVLLTPPQYNRLSPVCLVSSFLLLTASAPPALSLLWALGTFLRGRGLALGMVE